MNPTHPGVPSDAGAGSRFDAALQIQQHLARTGPNSDAHERADLALTLVLSPRRQPGSPSFLTRNALRDARKLLMRRRRRITTDPLTEDTPLGLAAAQGKLSACVSCETPLDQLVAADLERRIRWAVDADHGQRGILVLDALLSGEGVRETAAALCTSLRTVERLRCAIRRIARRITRERDE